VRLAVVDRARLTEVIHHAWRLRAPKKLVEESDAALRPNDRKR
jgi:hypothetical protein